MLGTHAQYNFTNGDACQMNEATRPGVSDDRATCEAGEERSCEDPEIQKDSPTREVNVKLYCCLSAQETQSKQVLTDFSAIRRKRSYVLKVEESETCRYEAHICVKEICHLPTLTDSWKLMKTKLDRNELTSETLFEFLKDPGTQHSRSSNQENMQHIDEAASVRPSSEILLQETEQLQQQSQMRADTKLVTDAELAGKSNFFPPVILALSVDSLVISLQ